MTGKDCPVFISADGACNQSYEESCNNNFLNTIYIKHQLHDQQLPCIFDEVTHMQTKLIV